MQPHFVSVWTVGLFYDSRDLHISRVYIILLSDDTHYL